MIASPHPVAAQAESEHTLVEIFRIGRAAVLPLFAGLRHYRPVLDAALASPRDWLVSDSRKHPTVAALGCCGLVFVAGDADSPHAPQLIAQIPRNSLIMVHPERWAAVLLGVHPDAVRTRVRSFRGGAELAERVGYIKSRATDLIVRPIDPTTVERMKRQHYLHHASDGPPPPADLPGRDRYLAVERSLLRRMRRGIGYYGARPWAAQRVLCSAYALATYGGQLEIQVNCHRDHRRRGLATAVCAHVLADCLANNLEPRWTAATAISRRMAAKLGFVADTEFDAYLLPPMAGSARPTTSRSATDDRCQ
jgi:hypothetical protein